MTAVHRRVEPACCLRRAVGNELGPLDTAACEGAGAARMEGATGGNLVQPRHRTVDLRQPVGRAGERGDRAHQPDRIGVARPLDDVAQRADFGDAPGIHDRHAVGSLGDDADVVGDQHDSRAMVAAELLDEGDDLRLDRHVERRGRLVGDDELRIAAQRQRDDDALAHAAREVVGVVVEALGRGRDADFGEQLDRARAGLARRHLAVRGNRLDELSADAVERVEAGQRILEDGADALAADLPQPLGREVVDALAGKHDTACRDAPRPVDEADDGGAGHRFAGAGFADHAQHLAGADLERHIVDRDKLGPPCREFDAQMFDAEQRLRHQRSLGLSASRSQSPRRLTDSTSSTSARPGKMVIHHSPENRKSLPMRISVPSEGCVGGTPTPRKDNVTSVMMASARLMVAMTSTGPITLGSTWRSMMASGWRPMTRAAWTYSLPRSTMVEPRTVRAYCTQKERPIDRINTSWARLSWNWRGTMPRMMPSTSKAMRMAGKLSWISAMRMMMASVTPPTYPETRPSPTPSTIASRIEAKPTQSEMREP